MALNEVLGSKPGGIFVIVDVHVQCSQLFKNLECAVLSVVLCITNNSRNHAIILGYSPVFLSLYCHECAESGVKQYSLHF